MRNILIGLSGGINSMAVLCWLAEQQEKPSELHLFYAHFEEHSDDTLPFVLDGVEFAKNNFENVIYKQTNNSILKFFEEQKMIPHPVISPCSRVLKIEPVNNYMKENGIEIDLVGYVKHELLRRTSRQKKSNESGIKKMYPIGEFTDEWCFEMVDKHIG